jgi:hypothetical protein
MNEEMEEIQNSSTPENALDFNMLNINSVWGKNEIPPELKEALTQRFNFTDSNNTVHEFKKSNWNLLGFFTRDFRLGNLDSAGIDLCDHYGRLANELINIGFSDPCNICLARIALKLELSQSKNGFLRKQNNTLIQEKNITTKEPTRKNLFGGVRK